MVAFSIDVLSINKKSFASLKEKIGRLPNPQEFALELLAKFAKAPCKARPKPNPASRQ